MEEEEDPPDGTVNLIFVRDPYIAKLNRKFTNRVGPTDVLSFPLGDKSDPEAVWGEIYISTDCARRQAKNYQVSFSRELLRLCCHGLLHLLRYDHKRAPQKAVMQAKEENYLRKVI
jgi:rRNA maturation RNase YbeY